MRQIVIRKDPVPALNSRVSLMGCGSSIHISCPETADALLKDAVNETVPLAALLEEFRRFTAGQPSALFARMYQLSETSGLVIDQNIYLYHCDVCPVWVDAEEARWAYMGSKKYLGDSWWFVDDEILKDVREMNVVAFWKSTKAAERLGDSPVRKKRTVCGGEGRRAAAPRFLRAFRPACGASSAGRRAAWGG